MTRQSRQFSACSTVLLALLALAAPARAQTPSTGDPAAAQALFDQGKKLMAEGKSHEACPKFAESQRLDPGVGTLLNLAACYETAGQSASAWNKFLEAESAARAEGNAEASRVARARAEALAPKLSRLVISVAAVGNDVPGLEVRRDDAVVGRAQWGVPIPVDPGNHLIRASAPNREPWEQAIEVKGQGSSVAISVPALRPAAPNAATAPAGAAPASEVAPAQLGSAPVPAPSPASPQNESSGFGTTRAIAVGAGVVGLAGLTIGTIFGLQSKSKHDSAADYCDDATNVCTNQEGVNLRSDAIGAGNVSTVGFIVGVAGIAGAAVLWFTAKPAEASAPAVGLGPGSVAVRGLF